MSNKNNRKYRTEVIKAKKVRIKDKEVDLKVTDKSNILIDSFGQGELEAELLIDMLVNGSVTVSMLTVHQKNLIFLYLFKYTKIGRVIDLHVKLPLSSMRLQKPKGEINDILQDYVYNFFETMFNTSSMRNNLYKAVYHYWLYGRASMLVMDDYEFVKTSAEQPMSSSAKSNEDITEEDLETTKKYNNNNQDVDYEQRMEVINKLINQKNLEYKGVIKTNIIPPDSVLERRVNRELDYSEYRLSPSPHIKSILESINTLPVEEQLSLLEKVGYTKGYAIANMEADSNGLGVDTDPVNDLGMYIAEFENMSMDGGDDNSLMNRVVEDAINYLSAKRRDREKSNKANRRISVVTVPDNIDVDKFEELQSKILEAIESPNPSAILADYNIDWNEITIDFRESDDLKTQMSDALDEILSNLGIPNSLVGGEDSYGSAFIKTELLTNEYVGFRKDIKNFVEEKIFKPVAIKKGFFVKDNWGTIKVLYPTLKFDKLSIARGTEDFNLIKSMVDDGKLPVKGLLDTLGYDYEDVISQLNKEKDTILNPSIKQLSDNALDAFTDAISSNEDFKNKVLDALNISNYTNKNQEN